MASLPDSAFFPPLDRCLAGEVRLLSWKTAYRALCDLETAIDSAALKSFLTDTRCETFLRHALRPFPQRSTKTKSDFETKTAPIHVSYSVHTGYDLDELKKDALWLSEQVDVEETIALRVVIIEWQQRSEDALLLEGQIQTGRPLTPAKDRKAPALNRSAYSLRASIIQPPTSDFSNDEIRRQRQLRIFLEEKSHILKICTDLAGQQAVRSDRRRSRSWIDELTDRVTKDGCVFNDSTKQRDFSSTCLDSIRDWAKQIGDVTACPEVFQGETSNQLYSSATFSNIIVASRLFLASICIFHDLHDHRTVLEWFKLMADVNFFQHLTSVSTYSDVTALQCLTSVISLALLQLPRSILYIQNASFSMLEGPTYPTLDDRSYISNDACLREVNIILYRAAEHNFVLAAPAIYAWSIITGLIRDFARAQQEVREQHRLEDGSSDNETTSRRRASGRDSADELSLFEKRLVMLQDFELEADARDDPPLYLARAAVDHMGVYVLISQLSAAFSSEYNSQLQAPTSHLSRNVLLELVKSGMSSIVYGAEVLDAIYSTILPGLPDEIASLDSQLANSFSADQQVFGPTILEQALARYPYELSPMLRVCMILASATNNQPTGPPDVVLVLETLQTMTVVVAEHFKAYTLDHEDENTNSMVLTESLPVFVSKQKGSFYRSTLMGLSTSMVLSEKDAQNNVLEIPSGVAGVVVKESRPLVLKLEHPHSALEFLGLILSTLLRSSQVVIRPPNIEIDRPTAAEVVTLINSILGSCLRQHQGVEEARVVLGRLGFALHDEQDVVSVVADILEAELLAHLDQSALDGSLELLVACARFFDLLTQISPKRVWSTLAHSSLLGLNGGANALAAVVAGREVQIGRYRFLAACVGMYSHLLNDAVTGLVKRKGTSSKATNRFNPLSMPNEFTPERTISVVLDAYQTVMLDAWLSLPDWRFNVSSEKWEIASLIVDSFEILLQSTYGIDITKDDKRLSSLLLSSARRLVHAFTTGPGDSTLLQVFLTVLSTSASALKDDLPIKERLTLLRQTAAVSNFLTTVVRTTKLIDQSGRILSKLGTELLKNVPAIAILLASEHSLKKCLSTLLAELVQAVSNNGDANAPSLLSYLNPIAAELFLSVLSQLDRPLQEVDIEISMWSFLSVAMASKQQWIAIYLVTGNFAKSRMKDKSADNNPLKRRSLLAYALDQLSNIPAIPPERAASMLKFVAASQNASAWATTEVRSHSDFLKNSVEWLNDLRTPSKTPNMSQELILANEHQIAAHLCDILAVNLHASLEIGDLTILKLLVSKLDFLTDHAIRVDAYNRSLHRNLAENFTNKFPHCEITDFARTAANPASYGRDYYYDSSLANKILSHEMAWAGAVKSRNQGFVDEFARANINLSLVEAQTQLLKSWNVLATTMCAFVEKHEPLRAELAKAAEKALKANAGANLELPGMDGIVKSRVEMAFVILSRLVAVETKDMAMKAILPAAWDLVRGSPIDYDVATSPEDIRYYRTLLQVLYLAIQPHVYIETPSQNANRQKKTTEETAIDYLDPATASCLLEIVARLIAPGFRALCGNLHNGIEFALPGDFALLAGLLQVILSVRGIDAVHTQIADVIASTSVVRGALSLFSWADQLAELMDQDPVYGEVAIVFLLALSTIRQVAEQMALEGILIQLSSANLSNYFRKPGGKGPFDEPGRMFTIWSEGFLSLALNLLDAIGPSIAAEVATFLNGFPQQLTRASKALENREPHPQNPHAGAVTLGLVSEAHSLCTISLILSSDVARGAAEGINAADVPQLDFNYMKVKDDAAALFRQRTSLSARIVPIGEREVEWRDRSVPGASENLLQGKVVNEVQGLLRYFKA